MARAASRTAIAFAAAAALAACEKTDRPVAVYGPAPIDESRDAGAPSPNVDPATPDAAKDGGK